jgi:membrane dipeptidase
MEFDRRTMMATAGAAAAIALRPRAAGAQRAGPPAWYRRAIVIDGLSGFEDIDAGEGVVRYTDSDWAGSLATGVTALRDTVLPVGNVADPWAEYQAAVAEKKAILGANPDRFLLVRSAADILRAKRERKIGIILGTQDTAMVGPALDRLAQMKKDGVMTVQLTYNNANLAGDGALEPRNAGLTKLGKATIERIEAEKLLLDLSHGGARTMAEAVAAARRPLVISHTAARDRHEHPRNTHDATIKAVADKGGVVGVYFMPFLTADGKPRGADLIAHIEHVARVAGEDHVGIGTDNGLIPLVIDAKAIEQHRKWNAERVKAGIAAPGEGPDVFPMTADYNSIDRYWRLANDLARRGWSEARLEKLMGGNFLRVYREAWGG